MIKNMQRILAAGIVAVAAYPASAVAWQRAKHINYPATAECLSENLCVFFSCPAVGKPSLEMMIDEHGRMPGEEISIFIDGTKFPLILPERGEHNLYRWPLSTDLVDAIMKGKRGEVRIDPDVKGRSLPLRGSSSAIGKVQAQCAETTQAQATKEDSGRLTGLSSDEGCVTATTTGVVVDRELNAKSKEISGFRLKDKHGTGFINVDPPKNRAAVQQQLLQMIVPGAKLRATVHACGAAGRVEVLSAVERIK